MAACSGFWFSVSWGVLSGDVRRLADLFGLSIQAGTRYPNVLSHPHLSGSDQS